MVIVVFLLTGCSTNSRILWLLVGYDQHSRISAMSLLVPRCDSADGITEDSRKTDAILLLGWWMVMNENMNYEAQVVGLSRSA